MFKSVADRFITRLSLGELSKYSPKVEIISIEENKKKFDIWEDKSKHKKILTLYHATDELKNYRSIMEHGFYIGSACNKGYGVYLANHGRYSAFWTGGEYVLACDVIYDKDKVKRYRSEVKCESYDSEYVVTDTSLLYPRYLINYKLTIDKEYYREYGLYVKHGTFGCSKCDPVNRYGHSRRCDCPFKEVDERDFVN